ncbi:ADP-ribosylglycohydrolase family protein [Propionivibrio dicarboxylicus]|nr:ADP-ribosylglycohydrolase family protein [Propionivibrio dicarboxylicus]
MNRHRNSESSSLQNSEPIFSGQHGQRDKNEQTVSTTSTFLPHLPEAEVRVKFRGCLLGGAVGDALGAPVEFMKRAEIVRQFGARGIQDMVPAYGVLGAITDDTQMTLFTAEGLLRGYVRSQRRGICHPPSLIDAAYRRWLHTQEESPGGTGKTDRGWLFQQTELFAQRAPGMTCIAALKAKRILGTPADNDSKGCGGVMRVAPVGMMLKALSAEHSALRDANFRQAFDLACQAAALTHGHPTGQLTAGAFAAIIFLLLEGQSLRDSIEQALVLLREQHHHEETTAAINRAVDLAERSTPPEQALDWLGEGWIAEEALAVGIFCALTAKDFESGVVMAVNHNGDSDSTGLIAGHLLGALHGIDAVPERWLKNLELRGVLEIVADDLATVAKWTLDDDQSAAGFAESDFYTARYPGS